MKLIKKDNSNYIGSGKQIFINRETIVNPKYLYPNGHRITHQMRWFKVSKDMGLKSDEAA